MAGEGVVAARGPAAAGRAPRLPANPMLRGAGGGAGAAALAVAVAAVGDAAVSPALLDYTWAWPNFVYLGLKVLGLN